MSGRNPSKVTGAERSIRPTTSGLSRRAHRFERERTEDLRKEPPCVRGRVRRNRLGEIGRASCRERVL